MPTAQPRSLRSGLRAPPLFLRRHRAFALTGLAALLTGCALHGPGVTQRSHLAYNEALQASEQHELLLNIVRLRYLDAPDFLSISSISTQMTVAAGASVLGQFGDADGERLSTVAPGASIAYSEAPVVTFTPQHQEGFTRQLVTPASLDSVYLLTRYGWGIDRVLALVAENVNGLENSTSRERHTDPARSAARDFRELGRALRTLSISGLIDIQVGEAWEPMSAPLAASELEPGEALSAAVAGFRYAPAAEPGAVVLEKAVQRYRLQLHPDADGTAALEALHRLAGLRQGQNSYEIDPRAVPGVPEDLSLRIRTRSVLASMAWLSHGVAAPPHHVESGLASPGGGSGEPVAAWFAVRQAVERPASAWLAVPYRGFWFYIDSGDLQSRRTLGLLSSLLRLEITAGGARNVPVLTLPVSR